MTTFNPASHKGVFLTGANLTTVEQAPLQDIVMKALVANGLLDVITISATAPAGPAAGDIWLRTSTTPATLRVYSGTAWGAATFADVFGSIGVKWTYAATPPAGAKHGDYWMDSDDEVLYVRGNLGGGDGWLDILSAVGGAYVSKEGGTFTGQVIFSQPNLQPVYAAPASLPAAASNAGAIVYCEGMTGGGGATGAVFCDGTNWRKARNGNIIA